MEGPDLQADGSSFFIGVSASSFISFLVIFCISPTISCWLLRSYEGFTETKKINWDTRIGSNLHAVVVSVIALYCFVFDQASYEDLIWGKSVLIRCGISITHGYLVADFVIVSLNYKAVGDVPTMVHHIIAICGYLVPVVQGLLLFVANLRQLAEISTPFVNQRWYYSASKTPHSSPRFIVNGLCMVLAFFLCRIATMPYLYYLIYNYWERNVEVGHVLGVVLLMCCIALDIINSYWMYKMIRGGLGLLREKKSVDNNNKEKMF